LKRLEAILQMHQQWTYYHQGDPRGCTLYLVLKADVKPGEHIDQVYTRGIAVCA
jgi:hypothetical protein